MAMTDAAHGNHESKQSVHGHACRGHRTRPTGLDDTAFPDSSTALDRVEAPCAASGKNRDNAKVLWRVCLRNVARADESPVMKEHGSMPNRYLKPESMPAPFGYSQVVESTGTRIVHVAGQVPLNTENNLVGEGDFAAQVRQSFENVRLALEAVGMTFNDVVKMQFFLTDISNLPQVRGIRDEYINTEQPPASTSVQVVALYRPEVMFEMDVIAIA